MHLNRRIAAQLTLLTLRHIWHHQNGDEIYAKDVEKILNKVLFYGQPFCQKIQNRNTAKKGTGKASSKSKAKKSSKKAATSSSTAANPKQTANANPKSIPPTSPQLSEDRDAKICEVCSADCVCEETGKLWEKLKKKLHVMAENYYHVADQIPDFDSNDPSDHKLKLDYHAMQSCYKMVVNLVKFANARFPNSITEMLDSLESLDPNNDIFDDIRVAVKIEHEQHHDWANNNNLSKNVQYGRKVVREMKENQRAEMERQALKDAKNRHSKRYSVSPETGSNASISSTAIDAMTDAELLHQIKNRLDGLKGFVRIDEIKDPGDGVITSSLEVMNWIIKLRERNKLLVRNELSSKPQYRSFAEGAVALDNSDGEGRWDWKWLLAAIQEVQGDVPPSLQSNRSTSTHQTRSNQTALNSDSRQNYKNFQDTKLKRKSDGIQKICVRENKKNEKKKKYKKLITFCVFVWFVR